MTILLSIFVPAHRTKLLVAAAILTVAIAVADWATKPFISLGFLYLFPIFVAGGFLSRPKIVATALVCAVLQELFSHLPESEAFIRLGFSSIGFIGTGLLVAELVRSRRSALQHVEELQTEAKLRLDVERELQVLVESSPAAIITIDATGTILLANQAAQRLLSPDLAALNGQKISSYLPSLQTVIEGHPSRSFRTAMHCKGQRTTGEPFLAGVWFSTYIMLSGARLAAVVVDLSEDFRDREELSLDYLLKNSRILVGAVAHELGNLCGAALVVHKNLSRFEELQDNEDFRALKTLIQSLERIAALGGPHPADAAVPVDLTSVLDELRVLIDDVFRDSGIEIEWRISTDLPLLHADRYGLIQVFLNLARNSRRAMELTPVRKLSIWTEAEDRTVVTRIADTGTGVSSPDELFRPFQPGAKSTGLGLYVSRAIMRSFGGELLYEPLSQGCCFAVVAPSVSTERGSANE